MLFSDHDAYVGRALGLYGEYSEVETRFLRSCINPGDIVIEAGANIGALTVPMALQAGPTGMVFAFEPQRTTYYALCGNVFLNNLKNTFCFQRALGDEPGVTMIPDIDYDFAGNYGAFSISEETAFDKIPNKLPVEINRLDDFGIQGCNLLKVDVEGMEMSVLKGAIRTIQEYKPMLYVENDRNDKRDELRQWVEALGYECWQHFPPHYSPDNYRRCEENIFGKCVSANLFAYHKDSGLKHEDFAEFELLPADIKITVIH
jgi:FkbM family methyltransferase